MLKSMTGYGRANGALSGRDITAEVRSVNHRYFEVSMRYYPRAYSYLEERLKQAVQASISRGKIEVNLTVLDIDTGSAIEINMGLARGYIEAIRRLNTELGVEGAPTVSILTRFPDIFAVKGGEVDENAVWRDVSSVLADALTHFNEMRAAEGGRMRDDMEMRLQSIEDAVRQIEDGMAGRLERYREKLTARMKQVLENTSFDENRILLEAALYADKSCVDEETVRLHSHIEQFRSFLDSETPVGRKLDFLVQEMNREANTIGSKAGDLGITQIVVDIKADIEKIREQIQNIE